MERPVRIAPPPDLVHLDADSTAPTPTRHAPVGEAAASRPLRETWEADGVVEDVDGDEDGGDEDGDTDAVAAPKAPLEAPLPNSEPAASPSRFPAPASTPAGAPPAFGRAVGKLFEHSRRRRVHGSDRPPRIRVGLDRPRALDLSLISRMERFLGERLPPVRIHTGSAAARLTRRLDADAATIGTHVFFAPGRFQPDTTEGRRLLAHELTHVLQRNRPHLDRRTAEAEAHRAEARFEAPQMEWFDPSLPEPPFRSAVVDGGGAGAAYAARRDRPAPWRGEDDGTFDEDAFLEALTERTVALLERAARDERIG